MIYTLDTNVIVDAIRQPAELDRLKVFLDWALPSTVLSSVVVAELIAGARTGKAREVLEHRFLAPFEQRGRLLAPSAGAWRRAADALADAGRSTAAGQMSDLLLAAQSRESGWTLITRDADFDTIRRWITGLKVAAPYPVRS